jgi:uncharacterized protein (TIGR02996 family)
MLGSDGRPSNRKTFDSKKAAASEVKERLAEQIAKGYTKLQDWDEPATPELLDAIAKDPTNAGSYLVYADWLQQKRHPRGELIVLQATRKDRPDDKKLEKAEAALLKKYPKLAPPRCAEVTKASPTSRRRKLAPGSTLELRWEYGFIAEARISRPLGWPPFTIRELLVELLEHPAGRFLRRLELGIRGDVPEVVSYVDALAELARLAPPSLRSLSVVEAPADAPQIAFSELGPLDGVLAAMPSLEKLHLAGTKMSFGDREMRGLKELSMLMTEPSALTSLVAGKFPALESLELDCGGADLDPRAAEQLFSGDCAPKLKRLKLARTGKTDLLITPLAKSALLPRLRELSLVGGTLSSEGLEARKAAFAHLEKLEIGEQKKKTGVALSDNDLAQLSQDSATFAKARKLAKATEWQELGKDGPTFWGRFEGSEGTYRVTFAPPDDTSCTCFANAYRGRACKHAVALAMLATGGHKFEKAKRFS